MDTETPVEKPKRGRRPKSQTSSSVDSSKLKRIELDEDLKELIERKNSSPQNKPLRVKLPSALVDEIEVNIASLNKSGNANIDVNSYVRIALELADENLSGVLRRYLSQ